MPNCPILLYETPFWKSCAVVITTTPLGRFDCKMAFRPIAFDRRVYGAAVKLEITYTGEVPRANFTLTSIAAPSFDFVLRKL